MALLHQVFLAGTVNKFELKHKKKKFNVFFPRIVEKGEQVLWEPPLLPCRCVQPKLKEEKLFTPPPPNLSGAPSHTDYLETYSVYSLAPAG